MPQSLLKTPPDAGVALQVNGRALSASHQQIASILRSRLGQNHGDLLAVPRVGLDGGVDWVTPLTGAVSPAAQLPDDERGKLEQRALRFQAEIRGLAQQLRGEGPAAQMVAQLLERALQTPPGQWLYSVGGRPVLVMWGHAAAGAPATPAAPIAAAAPIASAAAPLAADAPPGVPPVLPPGAPPPATPPGSGGWKRWLMWALLALLLLALLLWGLKRCSDEQRAAEAALAEQVAQAEARNKALEEEIARAGKPPTMQCVPDAPPPPPPPASAPEPAASAPPPVASAPAPKPPASQPPPAPKDDLKQRIAAADKNCNALAELLKNEPRLRGTGAEAVALKRQVDESLAKNCVKEAKNLCPGVRPKEIVPEMAIVFDASGSMNFSLDVTDAEIRQHGGQAAAVEGLMRQFGLGGLGGLATGGALERLTREPKRITVAKRAALGMVDRVPSDMNIGLVMVEQCPAARTVGMYPPSQRGALMGQIRAIEPRGGTPLADGIAKGGQLVDGVTREALIVVVSDGVESCGRDPCAEAAALKRAKPLVKINVVDITGTGAGNCVAQITGGKVFTARNADEVVAMTNRAAQEAMGPGNCKP